MLQFVREGNTVVVHSMDGLARNLDDLRRIVMGLTKHGIRVLRFVLQRCESLLLIAPSLPGDVD